MLFGPCVRFCVFVGVRVTEWPPVGGWLLARLAKCFLGVCAWLSIWFFLPRFLERRLLSDCAFS